MASHFIEAAEWVGVHGLSSSNLALAPRILALWTFNRVVPSLMMLFFGLSKKTLTLRGTHCVRLNRFRAQRFLERQPKHKVCLKKP